VNNASRFYLTCVVFVSLLFPGTSHSASAREVLADRMVGHARMSLAAGRMSEAQGAAHIAHFLAGRDDDERLLIECGARARELIERMELEARDARRSGDVGGSEHIEGMIDALSKSVGDG
jgi:hypothetical protein